MKKTNIFIATLVLISCSVAFNACKKKNTDDPTEEPKIAEAKIIPVDKSGVTGSATFTELDGKVTLKVAIAHAAPGDHGIHIHIGGDCSVGDKTNIAGGHWNPTGQPHGQWGAAAGFHRGDIGNITVGTDSTGSKEFSTDLWAVGGSDTTKNILNHAILVHEKPDTYVQPTGAAGNRLACGEIKLKQ